MKKLLVPTDFSETARNAAIWAARMAETIPGAELVLFHVYGKMEVGSDGSPLASDPEAEKALSMLALGSLQTELGTISSVRVSLEAQNGTLLTEIGRAVEKHGIDAVVMGITGASRLDQVMIGSNTLRLVDLNICPVFIIPPDAEFRRMDNIVFASDFKDVAATTPAAAIRKVLDLERSTLHVVNVDVEHFVEITEEYQTEKKAFQELFKGYKVEYYFIRLYDFTEAINLYAEDRKAGLIITVPKKHDFLSSLFKTSHTQKLAYHSHIPILALHA
jgi:nucleotide-binding universal stress UspA family protein